MSSPRSALPLVSGMGLRLRSVRLDQGAERVARTRALLHPVAVLLEVEAELRLARVVVADLLDEAPIARRAAIGRHDAVERLLLAALAGQPDADGHKPAESTRGPWGCQAC